MFLVGWLIIWLLKSTPTVEVSGDNAWFISLVICLVLSVGVHVRS